jgi:WD40 repeat protein
MLGFQRAIVVRHSPFVVEDAGTNRGDDLQGHADVVRVVGVTPDNRRAVSASADETLKEWELESGRALRTLHGHTRSVWAVAVTPDGSRAVSGFYDQTLKVWESGPSGKVKMSYQSPPRCSIAAAG